MKGVPGLIVVYTGNGKGKTTAALGLSLRAMGHNGKVGFMQFMKGSPNYGEVQLAQTLPNMLLVQCGRDEFVSPVNPDLVDIAYAQEGIKTVAKWFKDQQFDLIVLDEILVAISYGLISLAQVLELLKNCSQEVDVVLTGRYAPEEIFQIADTITIMSERRHAYQRGIAAKAGMEF